jgi:quinohemoprotein ethanol dehydrogenase
MNGRDPWESVGAGVFAGIVVVSGFAIAIALGFSIGHFTGHTETVTVGSAQSQPSKGQVSAEAETTAPAFTAGTLAALPRDNWLTNGGSLSNERYSPLSQIDTGNVKDLKGVWRTHLNGSAMAAKYSGEAQPIVYNGVMYIVTGADDVSAIDVRTGQIRWTYEAKLDQKIATVCCGWTSRGVGLGDGKVFVGQLDGRMVALDQQTGKVEWSKSVGSWKKGETITSAPLYYDGRVYTGLSGGEFGIRGRVTALDAKTGKEDWRFYTIPGPGETGHETWPSDNDSWKRGGAPVWQTPSVDPKLGLMYFSTGNAAPDLNGNDRAGDNLFAASIVAIDAKTGKYRWHFQQVHHDIWDYDAPSPTVLFDAEIGGKLVHGLAEPSKTGWLYMLDRETGKPIHGIEERAVPQDARQKTAKTQPFPSNPPFAPHSVDDATYAAVKKAAAATAKKGQTPKVERATQIFEPYGTTLKAIAPGPSGGSNWPPSSYNRGTHMVYVCGSANAAGYAMLKSHSDYNEGKVYIGSVLDVVGFGASPGLLTAIDVTTGRIAWQKKWADSCYSGTVTTAGNLVFAGRNGGELEAYDARNGTRLWSFQTGAGANSTVSVFQDQGKQYVALLSAGNSLAGSRRGDSVWLFSLDGKLGPAGKAGSGTAGTHAGENTDGADGKATEATSQVGDAKAGQQLFADNCSTCHGIDGTGGNGGPDLTSIPDAKDFAKVAAQVRNGGGGMPAFGDTLDDKQISDVAEYVTKVVNKK